MVTRQQISVFTKPYPEFVEGSSGYRLILNNILFPAATKKKQKT
jgi:hypothetical protein